MATRTPTTEAAGAMGEANQSLYRPKEAGRNRVHHNSGAVPMMAVTRR